MNNYNIVAVNYADKMYKKTQRLNTKTAYKYGKVDKVYECTRKDIDVEFAKENKEILEIRKGGGCWLWKPYIVKKVYEQLKMGDYLIYADAGGFFYINDVRTVINRMEEKKIWLAVQDQPFIEKHYTKRDTFIIMNCDKEEYTDSLQCMGGLFILKKCDIANKFLEEWLHFSRNINAISDIDNVYGKENYEGFVAHRNDQSIFSILRKKYKIKGFDDITQRGKYPIVYYHHTKYGKIWQIKLHKWIEDKKKAIINDKVYYGWISLKKRLKRMI